MIASAASIGCRLRSRIQDHCMRHIYLMRIIDATCSACHSGPSQLSITLHWCISALVALFIQSKRHLQLRSGTLHLRRTFLNGSQHIFQDNSSQQFLRLCFRCVRSPWWLSTVSDIILRGSWYLFYCANANFQVSSRHGARWSKSLLLVLNRHHRHRLPRSCCPCGWES